MLAALPPIACALLLGLVGAFIGAFINRAIYAWPYFLNRPISPWLTAPASAPPRRTSDRIPIFGWLGLRRESPLLGRGHWIRPMMIEIVWTLGLPWFYFWHAGGGLTGGPVVPVPADWNLFVETWFVAQTLLIALMFIATFIDFDERTIPDNITIPGTLIGLLIAASFPWSRLPQVVPSLNGSIVEPIHFASSSTLPGWHMGNGGLVLALGVFTIWILALLPKICTARYGWGRGLRIMVASCLRPTRKTKCSIRTRPRKMESVTQLLGAIWIAGMAAIIAAKWGLPAVHWDSLFGSLMGLAFGGGMVWSVRIVGRYAMQREAMGFGDVTLMAMIGAFLGWQPALLTFAIAPFAALFIVFVCFLVTKESELAFGPYLCFGCALLIFGWSELWPATARQFFFLGPLLFVFLGVALVLMAVLLMLIQWGKRQFLGEEIDT